MRNLSIQQKIVRSLPGFAIVFCLCLLTSGALPAMPADQGGATDPPILSTVQGQEKRLVVGSEQDYPPFAIGMTDDTAEGFTVDLWKAVALEAGLNYSIRVRPFHQLLEEFKAGKIDVLINLAQSEARHQFADFTVPHVIIHGAIFVRKGEHRIHSEDDFPGKAIIVLKADLAHDYALSKGWGKQLVLADTAEQGLRLLASGQHDAMLLGKLAGMKTLRELNIDTVAALDAKAGFTQKFSFAVQKGNADLLAKINEGLALTKPSGVFDALYEKWFALYEEKQATFWQVFLYLSPIIFMLLGFAGYEFYKRRIEHQRAAAQLALSARVFKEAREAIMITDAEGVIIDVNPTFCEITGYSRAEAIGQNPRILNSGQHGPEFFAAMWAALKEHGYWQSEMWNRNKDGELYAEHITVSTLCDEDGQVIHYVGFFSDISERKRIDQQLADNERHLATLLSTTPVGVFEADANGHYTYVNARWSEIAGLPFEKARAAGWVTALHPEDKENVYAEWAAAIAQRRPFHLDYRFQHADGTVFWVMGQSRESRSVTGELLGYSGTITDISGRKQAEEALQMMRFCVDNAGDSIFWISREGRILYVNNATCLERGYSREALLEMSIFDLDPDYQAGVWAVHFDDLKRRGSIIHKTRHRTKAGAVYPVEVNANYVAVGGHEFNFCFLRNITARNLMENELKTREAKFRSIIDISPVPMALNDKQSNITYLNPAFIQTFGYSVEDIPTLADWWPKAYPDADYRHWVKATWQATLEQAEQEDKICPPMEFTICAKEGAFKTVLVSATIITGSDEHLVVLFDITARKKADDYEQFRSGILEQLATNKPLPSILEALALGVEQLNSAMVCSILLLDGEGRHFLKGISPSLPDFYNEAVSGVEIGMGVGSCGTAAFTGQAVIVADIATHPYWAPYKEIAARAGLGACWSQPILSSVNKVLGTFAIYHRETHVPVASDMRFIEQSARLASLAIERKQAETDLIRSELKFHTLYDSISDAVLMLTEEKFFDCNKAAVKMYGCATREALCRYHPADLSPPQQLCGADSRALAREYIATAMKNGALSFEWLHQRVDNGQTFIVEVRLGTMLLDGQLVLQATVRDITVRKQNEIELRIAATAFESQEGMLVTDVNYNILRVNSAFTAITGYTLEEVAGKNPRIFQSGQHDADFYAAMWDSIKTTDTWQGEIWNRRKSGEVFPEYLTITAVKDQNGIISNYVATLTDITLRKEAVDKIERLAFYDPLTGLPNRRLLQDRLKPALASSHRSGRQGALLFIDMDNFKTLNDTLGHAMGDLLLQQVAQRLETCLREGDSVARLGGDEFVVMLEGLSEQTLDTATQTEMVGHKIMAALNRPYQLENREYHSTPSIGVTLFNGQEQSSEELLKQADIAMYQAKTSGRNALRFFDPQMQAVITARVALEEDMRLALKERQFILYYQSQVHHSGRIIGAEVLIRWLHPERGLVSPAEFIPLAEETHLIAPIGEWVLKTACAQLKTWEGHEHTRHLQLAVNVSARQFHQADFVGQVKRILTQNAVNPNRLKLELTESLVLDDIDDTIFKMKALRKIGVRFSMDDFGTGYSSLSSLKKLPLDQLKIDQTFVRDIAIDRDDTIIVETIIAMANKLNMEVIAEGVETNAQRDFLAQHDCLLFQGYLFSKPVPVEQFEQLLKETGADKAVLGNS